MQVRTQDPYVGFSSLAPLFIPASATSNSPTSEPVLLETAANKLRWFNAQRFTKRKQADAFRIFCLGGSTTYGRPYDDTTSFCGWLRELLPVADSSRKWEVINAGGISYASYRVVKVMEELCQYEPDLFVIYTGHNEFLEDRTYGALKESKLRAVDEVLSHSRVYTWIRNTVGSSEPSTVGTQRDLLPSEVKTMLDDGIGPDAFERDDQLARRICEHFKFNLRRMHRVAQTAGARMLLITPASNLAGCSPFKSELRPTLDESTERRVRELLEHARRASKLGQVEQAIAKINEALKLDPRFAAAHYQRGLTLKQMGRFDEAKQAFVQARDDDVCPLRATTPVEQAVRSFANTQGVPLVDFQRFLRESSPHGIPGDELFLDHVHPTIAGNRMLAEVILEALVDLNVVSLPADWGQATIDQVAQQLEGRIDKAAHGIALRNLAKVLSWAGKTEEANRLALRAADSVPSDANTLYMAANALLGRGQALEAAAEYRKALVMDPNYLEAHNGLGAALQRLGKLDEAADHYRRAIRLRSDFAPSYSNLALVLQQIGDIAGAERNFEHAIRINPRFAKARNNLAVLHLKNNRLAEAETQLLEVVSINPDFVEGHFNLGRVRQRLGRLAAAAGHFRRAIQINPEYSPAHAELGVLLLRQDLDLEAAVHLRKAISASRTPALGLADSWAWLLATSSIHEVRDGPEALHWARYCVKRTQARSSRSLSTLAAAHAELGQSDEAIRWQTRAVELAPVSERSLHTSRLEKLRAGYPIRRQTRDHGN